MLEVKITISAADLAAAINNLAAAFNSGKAQPEGSHVPAPATVNPTSALVPVAPMNVTPVPTAPQQTPMTGATSCRSESVNPTTAPVPAQNVPTIATAVPTPAPAPVQTTVVPTAPAVPTAAPQYTLDMIATAGSALIDAGKMEQLMQLLGRFGVSSLTELAPDKYGAVANELRAMGAAI